MENKIEKPKYFAVEKENSALWKDYIKWLNTEYNSTYTGSGLGYYGFDGAVKGCTFFDNFENNPTLITLNQWQEIFIQNKFILPEKWYLAVTKDNLDIASKWRQSMSSSKYISAAYTIDIGNSILSKHISDASYHYGGYNLPNNSDYKDYKEITTEEFIEHIYNPKFNIMEKKIIGYKLIKPEYKEAALKITQTIGNWENDLMEYDISKNQKGYINKLVTAGVFDLWFESIYTTLYKVGDWLTVIQNCKFIYTTFQLEESMIITHKSHYDIKHTNFGAYIFPNQIRIATQEEVLSSQEKVYILGINDTFKIVVKNKKAYYEAEDVTETLKCLQEKYTCETLEHKIGKYVWTFKDAIITSVGCITKESYLSQWSAIDLT